MKRGLKDVFKPEPYFIMANLSMKRGLKVDGCPDGIVIALGGSMKRGLKVVISSPSQAQP